MIGQTSTTPRFDLADFTPFKKIDLAAYEAVMKKLSEIVKEGPLLYGNYYTPYYEGGLPVDRLFAATERLDPELGVKLHKSHSDTLRYFRLEDTELEAYRAQFLEYARVKADPESSRAPIPDDAEVWVGCHGGIYVRWGTDLRLSIGVPFYPMRVSVWQFSESERWRHREMLRQLREQRAQDRSTCGSGAIRSLRRSPPFPDPFHPSTLCS